MKNPWFSAKVGAIQNSPDSDCQLSRQSIWWAIQVDEAIRKRMLVEIRPNLQIWRKIQTRRFQDDLIILFTGRNLCGSRIDLSLWDSIALFCPFLPYTNRFLCISPRSRTERQGKERLPSGSLGGSNDVGPFFPPLNSIMLAQSLSRARGAGGGLKRTHSLINKRTLTKTRPQEFVSSSCTCSLPLHPSLRHQQASSPWSLLNAHAISSSSSTAAGTAAREIHLSPYAIGPFMLATLCWSTYYYQKNCNEDLIQSIGPPAGESYQILSLFSLYRYLELTTDGPRFDLSEMVS